MDERPIILVPLTPKQIYDEQLKLKTGKIGEKKKLYTNKTFFANKVLSGFDDNVIFWFGTDLFYSGDDLHIIDSRMNIFREGGEDTNQVRYYFFLKILIDQFCEIKHISQTVHQIKLKFYSKILETWNYILINFRSIRFWKNIM